MCVLVFMKKERPCECRARVNERACVFICKLLDSCALLWKMLFYAGIKKQKTSLFWHTLFF